MLTRPGWATSSRRAVWPGDRKDFGFGDVKLAPALGSALGWYGWGVLLIDAFAGYLLSALYGVGLILARRARTQISDPFGPFRIAGVLLTPWLPRSVNGEVQVTPG
ncbi:hypothetical protein [Streptomyces sp. NPDC048392]|uniref:hypothetical protein n=1 Tax=Streptomyces sp. NPDC048392 TaxID=3365543 RepID=UPI003712395F